MIKNMEKNINIFDYLHNNLTIADYAELMEKWEALSES